MTSRRERHRQSTGRKFGRAPLPLGSDPGPAVSLGPWIVGPSGPAAIGSAGAAGLDLKSASAATRTEVLTRLETMGEPCLGQGALGVRRRGWREAIVAEMRLAVLGTIRPTSSGCV